jgi:hypothetical protein
MRKVVRDGKTVEEPVPVREYRYLRWSADRIGADQSVRFSARVRVVNDASPPPAAKGGGR